jgi:5-formyltetrahydrofolate cyclo-ligase
LKSVNPEASQKARKSRLRKKIREQRRNIRAPERLALDSAINRFLATFIDESRVRTMAAFWPFDGEPDLLPALHQLERQGIQLALPVIRNTPGSPSMIFRHWTTGAAMEQNHYGIPEPVGTDEILLPDIDLILLPLVGWDESGGRLGMGAGYYDRALQPFAKSNAPIRMGVAYQLQKLPVIPADSWDIRLHVILSESGWASVAKAVRQVQQTGKE